MSKKLFCIQNAKTIKGEALGYRTLILYLAPATEAQDVMHRPFTVCPWASPGCARMCLFTAGRGAFPVVRTSRIEKTHRFMFDRVEFLDQLRTEIKSELKAKHGMKVCVRLNGTSDINWGPLKIIQEFPEVVWYGYTKSIDRVLANDPKEEYNVFSRSETNEADCVRAIDAGYNVAVVFNTKRGGQLPAHYRLNGKLVEVIDGDVHDLRFLDKRPVIVGLRAKGRARDPEAIKNGFVVDASDVKLVA